MPKKTPLTAEEREALNKAMAGVKPLQRKQAKTLLAPDPIKQKPTRSKSDERDQAFLLNEQITLDTVGGDEYISYKQPSIPHKILRNLHKGQYNVGAILDLHGMTVETARSAVDRFLQQCLQKNIHVALIIHGKGHHDNVPVLKNRLNHWLREINEVLAFCSASPSRGQRGAIFVLLKRHTEENSFV